MHPASVANSAFLFAVFPLVLDSSKIAEEGVVAEFATLKWPDTLMLVQVECQSGVFDKCGRANWTGKEFFLRRRISITVGLMYPDGGEAIKVSTTYFACMNVHLISVSFQRYRNRCCPGRRWIVATGIIHVKTSKICTYIILA